MWNAWASKLAVAEKGRVRRYAWPPGMWERTLLRAAQCEARLALVVSQREIKDGREPEGGREDSGYHPGQWSKDEANGLFSASGDFWAGREGFQ